MTSFSTKICFMRHSKRILLNTNISLTKFLNIENVKLLHVTSVQNALRSKWRAPTLIEMKKRVDLLKKKGKYPLLTRPEFVEWNYDAELYAFGKRLNENFDDDLLREALYDSSYVFKEKERMKTVGMEEMSSNLKSNVELAESGLALITDFSTKYFRTIFPKLPEDVIRYMTEYLTSDEVLTHIGKSFGLRDLIMVKDYPPDDQAYARSFAAIIGCLNASSGLEKCRQFILDFVITQVVGKDLFDIWKIDDPMAILERILKNSDRGEPDPRLLGDIGKDTIESVFQVGIYDGNKEFLGKGYGDSVDEAVKTAAFDCLSRLFEQSFSRPPIPFEKFDSTMPLKLEPNSDISEWKIA